MTNNSVVRARIDERTKKKAAAALARLVPKEETIAAMREASARKLPRFKSTKDLLRELNEGD
jgi:antitoxin component of RelBE/YafQ-DinJ toxin-antitoxin module